MLLDVPPDWRALTDRLERGEWRRLIVVGAADTGKSTLCRYLGEQLPGLTLLDADLGQKIVGPPMCVTLGDWAGGALQFRRMHFIGDLHPVGQQAAVVAGIARLSGTPGLRRLVVNTSGLVGGLGIVLKRAKIDALEPEHIVAIEQAEELEPILAPLPVSRVHRLRSSAAAQRKRSGSRRSSREARLAAALAGVRQVLLPHATVEDLLRAPLSPDALRLCCVADESGEDRALGLIKPEQFERERQAWIGGDATAVHRIRIGIAVPRNVARAALPMLD